MSPIAGSVEPPDQLIDSHGQGGGELDQGVHAGEAPAALYEADLGPVQRGEPGELILRKARVVSGVKQVPAEPLGYLLIYEPAAHQIS